MMRTKMETDETFDLRSLDFKDATKSFGSIPPELEGQWKLRNAPANASPGFRLFSGGRHFIALFPYDVSFTADSKAMMLNGVPYDRMTSEPSGLNGLWRRH